MHSRVGENGESKARNEQPGREKTYAFRVSAFAAETIRAIAVANAK
jgi:hypothetical protein